MGICQQCIHFRRAKQMSQLFAKAAGTTDAAISNALAKMQEDESQQKSYESQLKTKKETAGDEVWEFRPAMTNYCGLHEAEDIYLILEVKNLGGRCTEFKEGRPNKQSCDMCAHRVVPQGRARDRQTEEMYSQLASQNIAVGLPTSTPDDLLNKHREGVASRIAFELAGAYDRKGHLLMPPQYLPYCRRLSDDDEYVVCLFQNPHHTCALWESAGERQSASVPLPAQSADTATRAASTDGRSPSYSGSSSGGIFVSGPAPQTHAASAPIASTTPPLIQEMSDAFLEMFSFIGAVVRGTPLIPVPQEVKDAYALQLASVYQTLPTEQQSMFAHAPSMWARIRADWPMLPPAQRAAVRHMWTEQFGALFQVPSQPVPMPNYAPRPPRREEPATETPISEYGVTRPVNEIGANDLLSVIQQADEAELEKAKVISPELAAQMKLQQQAKYSQLLSNMMQLSHETSMAIVKNIR